MIILGTDIKINVHIEPIDGLSMSDYDFECTFYVRPDKSITIPKSKMIKVDNDNYIALINSEDAYIVGKGKLTMEVTAYVTDQDFDDNVRTEKAKIWTGVTIV